MNNSLQQVISGLYIIATPIGNLDDITLRAISILKKSDYIICEDTRVANKILAKLEISCKLIAYNDHSTEKDRENILKLLNQNYIISLISDAGTPMIADPGYKLIQTCITNNIHIDSIPGPSAPICALTLSGLPTNQFYFAGFLAKNTKHIIDQLNQIKDISGTIIFFESAKRLISSLKLILQELGDKKACIARELTKLYQEIKRGKVSELIEYYEKTPPRGEIIILIKGISLDSSTIISDEEIKVRLENLINPMSSKDAVTLLYESLKSSQKINKQHIYQIANDIKNTK